MKQKNKDKIIKKHNTKEEEACTLIVTLQELVSIASLEIFHSLRASSRVFLNFTL
jgi:hypothetical protein